MPQFNLQTDFWTFVWPRIALGIGMGLTFIPLTTMTLSHIPKEEMTEASSLYNLVRNIGEAWGLHLQRQCLLSELQFHQSRLVRHLTPFDQTYLFYQIKSAHSSERKACLRMVLMDSCTGSLSASQRLLHFNDVPFLIICLLTLCVLPLVFLMKKPDVHGGPPQATDFEA